ncbi:hypothetical protein GC169_12175 [bacterium]|nr:hypothetical protein [bacterium]
MTRNRDHRRGAITRTLLLSGVAAVLAAACAASPDPDVGAAAPPAPAAVVAATAPPVAVRPPTVSPISAAAYETLLAHPSRPAADRADDPARKPADVLAFASIRPGDTVLEMEAGRGWYSEILSRALGPEGKLIVQYPPEFAYGGPAFKERTDAGGLKNARITITHFDKLDAPDASVDRVLWILGPHEIYYTPKDSAGLGTEAGTYAEIMRVLKPGGQFIAMDHAANAGAPSSTGQTIHRVDPAIVIAAAERAGLKLTGKSDVLANPDDDRTLMVFNPTVRRHTDQFLLRFMKPA